MAKYIMKNIYGNDDTEGESDKSQNDTDITVVGNNIYFYGGINQENIMKFNTELKKLEIEMTKRSIEFGFDPEINVFIHSEGGEVYYGLSAMDHIYSCSVHVNTIADGTVCSAATFMLLGGHYKYMMSKSSILIHQLRTEFWGKYEDLKDEHTNCDNIMKIVRDVYLENTNLSEEKLDELLKREVFLTPDECIKYGVVDEYY